MNNEDILIALKEIHARYCIPASERNYTDKDYACMQYEKLVIHLSNQLNKKKEVLDKIKKKVNQYEFISGYYDDNYDGEDTTYSHDTLKEEILELLGGYMETIKVIDLLNKIANGEEVPEKIKYITTNYIYDSDNQIYYKENYQDIGNYSDLLMELSSHKGIVALNDEIEIIEDTPEDKKIEKMEFCYEVDDKMQNANNERFKDFINEIIDKVNGDK